MMIHRGLNILCAATVLLTACAGRPDVTSQSAAPVAGVSEYIDDHSGVTVTSMIKPLLFIHDRPEKNAKLSDYVTITAAQVNRQGHRDCLLIAYLWSTLDARHEPTRTVPDAVVLVADERRIRLDSTGGTLADFGIVRTVGAPEGRTVKVLVLPTDLDSLGSIAAAHSLEVQANVHDAVVSYKLWDDQRKALEALVRYLNGAR